MSQPHSSPQIAVIGCGRWGKNLIRNFYELGVLAAVHDIQPERAQALAKQYHTRFCTQEDIYANASIDAVVIAVPSKSHCVIAQQALMAGKHVFVEKPLTLDYREAQQLAALAQKHKRILMVGHLLQYHPAFQELKRRIEKNEIGPLKAIYANRLSLGPIRPYENCLWDLAPHDFSMVLALVNNPIQQVSAIAQDHLIPGLFDTVTTDISFNNGTKARVFNSWFYPQKEQKFMTIGETGAFIFDDTLAWNEKLTHIAYAKAEDQQDITLTTRSRTPISLPTSEPLKIECGHFLRCIENQQKPLTNVENVLDVMGLLQKAQDSIDCNLSSKAVEPSYPRVVNI